MGLNKLQKSVRRRVIGGILGKMAEADAPAGIDDEDPGQLADVPFGDADAMPLGQGRKALHGHAGRKKGLRCRLFELKGLEKPFLRVGNNRKRNFELRLESRGFLDRPQADEYDAGTKLLKLFFFTAQLRHLLTAERSPVMAQENQHQRPFLPEPADTGDGIVP